MSPKTNFLFNQIICIQSSEYVSMFAFIEKGSDLDDRCNRTVEIYQTVSGPPVTDLNRGKPLHCTYRIRVRPQRDDWIVFVRFTRMRVGEPSPDRQKCIGGYVQIVDGYRETNHSNKDHSGLTSLSLHTSQTFQMIFIMFSKVLNFESKKYDNKCK